MDQDKHEFDAENSFLYFLITLQKLHLSKRVMQMMLMSNMILKGFVPRNRHHLQKPAGILIL